MHLSIFPAVALAATYVLAVPVDLDERQSEITRTQIEPSLYPILQRYTKFASASSATFSAWGRCPSPPFKSTLVRTFHNIFTDTQAAIFQDDGAKEIIVSFPGTQSLQDLLTDIAFIPLPLLTAPGCTNCAVHSGFHVAWRSVADDITRALSQLRVQKPAYSVIVVGHSLGGAIASLAFTDLKANNVPIKAAYTMGAPRVGNAQYATFTDKLAGASDKQLGSFIRITHNTDGVPSLPSIEMGFRHTRTEIYQLDNASGEQTAATTFRCFGQEAPDCSRKTATGFINQDHLKYTGVEVLSAAACNSTGPALG